MTNDTREKLKQLMSEKKLSQNAVAKAMGVNAGALSAWVNDTYKGDNAKIAQAVEGFLIRNAEKAETTKKRVPFVKTVASKRLFEIARTCHIDEIVGVAYGDSGVGKTTCAKEYVRQNNDVILVEADPGYTAKVVVSEIHQALGLDGKGSLHDMFAECVTRLSRTGRLIIIDEAESLPYKALEMLRRLHDKAEIGILLVGMPRLISNLRGRKGEFTQLYSRIGIASKLGGFCEDDTALYLTEVMPDGMSLLPTFHQVSGGDPRTLRELTRESRRLAKINGFHIPSAEHIKRAFLRLGRAL